MTKEIYFAILLSKLNNLYMNSVISKCVLQGQVLACTVKNGAAKIIMHLSGSKLLIAGGHPLKKTAMKKLSESYTLEIKPRDLTIALFKSIRLARTGDEVTVTIESFSDGKKEYEFFNKTECSVPLRLT